MSKLFRGSAALLTSLALAGASVSTAQAATVIDNTDQFPTAGFQDGRTVNDYYSSGQVITAPAGETRLTSATFYVYGGADTNVRGEVYAWDAANARPTGPALGETAPVSITRSPGFYEPSDYQPVRFEFSAPVVPGQQYFVFATTLKDGSHPAFNYAAYENRDTYEKGFVRQIDNFGARYEDLFTNPWNVYTGNGDLKFRAEFGDESIASGNGVSHVGTAFSFSVSGTKAAPAGSAAFTDSKGAVRSGDISCLNKVGNRIVFGIKDTSGGTTRYREFYAQDNGATGDRLAETSGSQTFTTPPRQGCRTTLTSSIKGDAIRSGEITLR